MKIGDQVVGVDLAQKMKELGAKQDSLWYWTHRNESSENWSGVALAFFVGAKYFDKAKKCSAYTVAELGEMLPEGYQTSKGDHGWCCEDVYYELAETEADTRAKIWITLKKEGLI